MLTLARMGPIGSCTDGRPWSIHHPRSTFHVRLSVRGFSSVQAMHAYESPNLINQSVCRVRAAEWDG